MQLHILHTNDVHSAFKGFSKLAYKIKSLREEWMAKGDPVFVFDLGDHADLSNPISLATSGRVNAQMLGSLPYDGWVLGNNETVTIDQHLWSDLTQSVHAPLYCSNLKFPGSENNLTDGYIYRFGDLKIGVFGVTVRYESLFENLGIDADDPIDTAWKIAKDMRQQGAHIIVMLSHLGLHIDKEFAQQKLPVDIIVGAHTHHFLDTGLKVDKTLIVQAGKHAQALGHVTLSVDDQHILQGASAELLYIQEQDNEDELILKILEKAETDSLVWLNSPIASITSPLIHQNHGESELVNLLCDQMKIEFEADVALMVGGIITSGLPDGVIMRRDLLSVCATPMRVVTMDVTGDILWKLINLGLRPELFKKRGYGFGFRGDTIGQFHVSGATIYTEREHRNLDQEKVVEITIGTEPLSMQKTYSIATGEFIALSPDISLLRGLSFKYHETMIRDLMRRALADPERIVEAHRLRYQNRISQA